MGWCSSDNTYRLQPPILAVGVPAACRGGKHVLRARIDARTGPDDHARAEDRPRLDPGACVDQCGSAQSGVDLRGI